MPHFVSNKEEMEPNISDITADFDCLKVSALGKVSRISGEIDRITIGPNLDSSENDHNNKFDNIENEQNSCNIKSPCKSKDEWSNKIATQSGITFSIRKILLEEELQRKEKVRKEIERKWQQMAENGTAIQKHISLSRSTMAQERERKSAQKYADILAEEERIAEQEEIKRKHEQQLHAQRAQEQKEKIKRDMEECRKKMKEKEELIKKIVALRHEFGLQYYDVAMLLKDFKDENAIANFLLLHAVTLKQLYQQVESLDEKIKKGDLMPIDLNVAETVVQQINEISCSLKAELDTVAAAETNVSAPSTDIQTTDLTEPKELPKSEEVPATSEISPVQDIDNDVVHENKGENNVQEIIPAAEIPVNQADYSEDTSTSTVPLKEIEDDLYKYVDKESLQIYIHSQEVLENHAKNYNEFLHSISTKQFRFECQKAINIPVNAISAINEQHLKDKYERLHNLLIGRSSPNVGQHPQGAAFCKDVLAKKIVSQGETLVSSKPKMAFAIAAIIVALWNDHADFGELLLAHFHNTCPFTAPVCMPKREGQTGEEYYKSLGYKYSEDGSVEKQDKFLKRMSGLMRLYISITVTPQRRGITKKHPHGLQHTWRWLAAVLNSESQPNTSDLRATLILDVLEVAGYMLWNAYPKQFHKMLMLLAKDYYPRMQNTDGIGGGPLVRLEEFLKNTLTRGSIPPPDGHLPPNFW